MRINPMVPIGCILFVAPLMAQTYPGCETRPEVDRAFRDDVNSEKVDQLPWKQQQAVRERVFNELIDKYPRDLRAPLAQIQNAKMDSPERLESLQNHYREMAAANPDDALPLALAAWSLYERDTSESIRLAEAARAKAPKFWFPAMILAQEYVSGLHADKEKFARNLRAYFELCPSGGNAAASALRLLPKLGDPALQASVARAMRTRLDAETDVTKLTDYRSLWGLEFRSTPPAGHDALRKQVAEDVRRLESLNGKPDSNYFELLLDGYKQSGASAETKTAFEDRMIRNAPTSYAAYKIVSERWRKENKEPESQADVAAWDAYNAKYLAQLSEWEKRFTDVGFLAGSRVRLLLEDGNMNQKEGMVLFEKQLAHDRPFYSPGQPGDHIDNASLLVEKKWNPDLALSLLAEARAAMPQFEKLQAGSDNLTESDRNDRMEFVTSWRDSIAENTLKAALLAHKPEAAGAVRAQVVRPLEKDAKADAKVAHWQNLALLALVDKHPADALTYFQLALQARPEDPQMYHGKLEDPLKDDAKEAFIQTGGTETAFVLWSAKPAVQTAEKEGRWEKPKKELPAFELSDLSGKTWKLKQFEGKTFMINLWATWCGPCQAELPHFQKLYDQVKDRPDLQVITFNMDEEPGLVSPFMKEKGYTFPVLLAYDFTKKLLDSIAIPQNWIIDKQGKWQATQIGYGAEEDWVGEMMKRLESAKAEVR